MLRTLLLGVLPSWQVVEADGLERAISLTQLNKFDIFLLDAELAHEVGSLEQLTAVPSLPLCLLANDDANVLSRVLEREATHWLPCDLALRRPVVLATVLRRAVEEGDLQRRLQHANDALVDSRRQVEQLVNRLWDTVPSEFGMGWFTYRHMLERLHEEVERVRRYGGSLSVLLGEMLAGPENGEASQVASWTSDQIRRWKRRSDVAGQYGPHGFMLLLPRTPEPGALGCCRRLQTLLEQPGAPLRGPRSVYFGVAGVESEMNLTVKGLLRQAEERLEQAKKAQNHPAP